MSVLRLDVLESTAAVLPSPIRRKSSWRFVRGRVFLDPSRNTERYSGGNQPTDTRLRGAARWCGRALQVTQPTYCVFSITAAHLFRRLKSAAECGPLRLAKNQAQVVVPELNAPNTCRFSIWHTRNGTGNGRGNATSPAVVATVHKV